MTNLDDLKMYVLPGCPWCAKVDAFLSANDVTLEHLDVTQGTNGDDLIALGGKRQCPCLVVDGRAMYESSDIIAYLADRLGVDAPDAGAATGGSCTFTPDGGHVCS